MKFRCECGWEGDRPSYSDTSEPYAVDDLGRPMGGTIHIAVCPKCFKSLRKVQNDPIP